MSLTTWFRPSPNKRSAEAPEREAHRSNGAGEETRRHGEPWGTRIRPSALRPPGVLPGVFRTDFNDIVPGSASEQCTLVPDPIFNVGGVNVRRVEPRNTPTVVNAIFTFRNFWDGRASFLFNGVNPVGPRDPSARVLEVQ